MPEDLKAAVAAQAERAGVSLNQYLLSIVAAHAGSQAETERYFAARAARSSPDRALEILARAGQGNPPEPGGRAVARPRIVNTTRVVTYERVIMPKLVDDDPTSRAAP